MKSAEICLLSIAAAMEKIEASLLQIIQIALFSIGHTDADAHRHGPNASSAAPPSIPLRLLQSIRDKACSNRSPMDDPPQTVGRRRERQTDCGVVAFHGSSPHLNQAK
jgi:hypothetical protein